MGNGIAHVFAKGGYNVALVDVEQRFLDRGLDIIRKNMEREVSKAKLTTEQRDQALARITATTDRNSPIATSSLRRPASASRSSLNSSAISTECAGRKSFSAPILRRFPSPSWRP
jgi:3-hydroxybutyryl-CoA dehydrogenase